MGQNLPALWRQGQLSRKQQKALLRCLIDKVVAHRASRDQIHLRIVWKGGEVSTFDLPITVGSLANYSKADIMTERILAMFDAGLNDSEIAAQLTGEGFRSPKHPQLLRSTVQGIRLRHGKMQTRHQSHPRQCAGYLTVPRLARALQISRHWIYDRIHNGMIEIDRDEATGLYLFPDQPDTLEQLRQLQQGLFKHLHF